jgi:hypothetical protein
MVDCVRSETEVRGVLLHIDYTTFCISVDILMVTWVLDFGSLANATVSICVHIFMWKCFHFSWVDSEEWNYRILCFFFSFFVLGIEFRALCLYFTT